MKYIVVEKSGPLDGAVRIPGSKNSSLALLAAGCLSDATVRLEGIPDLNDFRVIAQIGKDIGLRLVRHPNGDIDLDPRYLHSAVIDPGKASCYRASYYFIGALLAKFGKVTIGFPGGDNFVSRPIDQHVKALRALGAKITFCEDYYVVEAAELRGADIYFDTLTCGGTINAMLAAVRARGRTHLWNAALDPEVVDTANFLNLMGARIVGAGTSHIRIDGVPYLGGCVYSVIPDRLVAGAFLMAPAMTGGQVTVSEVIPAHLESCAAKLREAGLTLEVGDQQITSRAEGPMRPVKVRAGMYPEFATDLQQPMTALLTRAWGKSTVTDRVYPERFNHVAQLKRMGADIEIRKDTAVIRGGRPLKGTTVHATDVRAGTCLLLAGLAAEGRTIVTGVEHIERGYENAIGLFRQLGARMSFHHEDTELLRYREYS